MFIKKCLTSKILFLALLSLSGKTIHIQVLGSDHDASSHLILSHLEYPPGASLSLEVSAVVLKNRFFESVVDLA